MQDDLPEEREQEPLHDKIVLVELIQSDQVEQEGRVGKIWAYN